MPIWLSLLVWRFVIPLFVSLLRKWGYINLAEALAAKILIKIKSLKTYPEYPDDPPVATNKSNFTVGAKQEPKT